MKYYEKDKYEGNIYVNDSNIDEISSKKLILKNCVYTKMISN